MYSTVAASDVLECTLRLACYCISFMRLLLMNATVSFILFFLYYILMSPCLSKKFHVFKPS